MESNFKFSLTSMNIKVILWRWTLFLCEVKQSHSEN